MILQGLTDLQQIVQYGGDMVIKKASEIIVPPRISKKFDHISREKMVTFKLNTEPAAGVLSAIDGKNLPVSTVKQRGV